MKSPVTSPTFPLEKTHEKFVPGVRRLNPQCLLRHRNGLVAHRLRRRWRRWDRARSSRALEAPARLLNFGTELIREDGQGLQLLLTVIDHQENVAYAA